MLSPGDAEIMLRKIMVQNITTQQQYSLLKLPGHIKICSYHSIDHPIENRFIEYLTKHQFYKLYIFIKHQELKV